MFGMYLDIVKVTGGTKVKATFPWNFCKIMLIISLKLHSGPPAISYQTEGQIGGKLFWYF